MLVHGAERFRITLERLSGRMVPPHFALLYEIAGVRNAQALCTAAQLGIADTLKDGPLTADEIAERVGASPDGVARLMRLLSSRSLFKQLRNGRYALAPMSEALRTDSPVSMRAMALLTSTAEVWEHWGHLTDAVRLGQPVVPKLRGMSLFDYLEEHPEFGALFHDAMTSISNLAIGPVLAAYDFSGFSTIVDVGGGHGAFLAAILRQARRARGVLFDLPSVTTGARWMLEEDDIAQRCSIQNGSFFDEVPHGADAYVLKAVVHDWPEPEALQILGNVRSAIRADGSLVLVEMVVPDDDLPHTGKLLDLDMLLTNGGRERTAAEYSSLLSEAGFRLIRVTPTMAPVAVVEAAPA
jgi:hypothetical protein